VAGIGITWPVVRSRLVDPCRILPNFICCLPEFIMIHHLARAFFIRNTASPDSSGTNPPSDGQRPAGTPPPRPVKARPITPWGTPARQPGNGISTSVIPLRATNPSMHTDRRVRICTDPADARRTVIAGRFAEVCAALDRLVMEQEAVA